MSKIKVVTNEEWQLVNELNKQISESFLNQLHLSPHTLKQYESAIKIFFRWVHSFQQNKPIYKLKPRHGLEYQNYLIKSGLANGSVRFKRSVVSSLCNFVETYYDDEDDFSTFRNIFNKQIPNVSNEKAKEKIPLTKAEYELLCNELEKREQWQMLAFLKFTFVTGCRKSEVHQLLKEVVEYEKEKDKEGNFKNFYMTHKIRAKGKGIEGKVRRLVFDEDAMSAINKWLEVRGEDECPYVFVNKTQDGKVEQLSTATFNYWLSKTFSEIVGRHIWVHLLRSSRATILKVEEGKDIKEIQFLLGHNDPSTTQIYIVEDDSDVIDGIFD